MLLAYLDPSGTHKGSPMISIAGFVAEESKWDHFGAGWSEVLSKASWPSKLTRFHMFDCVHCEGEFFEGRWRFAERLALYGELVVVIRKFELRPVGASVVASAFGSLPPEDLELLQKEDNSLGTPLDLSGLRDSSRFGYDAEFECDFFRQAVI